MRKMAALVVATAALAVPQAASAEITSVFGGDVACTVEGDGARFCGSTSPRSTTKTFDGVPLDVNVAFPPAPASGPDGNYPLVMLFHGYGGSKFSFAQMQRWLDKGYATFSMTDRGFRESCGSPASRSADPAGCAAGYVRLIDNRYEVRDAQLLSGKLVDEGLVNPVKLAAIGGSYGGGMSMALAALRDRVAMLDGSLVPWTSPGGTPMSLAAAAPSITWSDLAYSLVPNGSTLDYVADAPYRGRFGVMKESLVNGLYLSGQAAPGYYAPPGIDQSSNLTGWKTLLDAGEPYDGNPEAEAILDEITSNHSSYYIDDSIAPAPILFSNGFTDDLFPADEAIRFYNRTRTEHPEAKISLIFGEIAGHPRSTNKANVTEYVRQSEIAWFDHYVMGLGEAPHDGVTAFTQTCPNTEPGGGPTVARSWARIAPGEIRVSDDQKQTIAAGAGDPQIASRFDPVTGGGACATTDGADQAGVATLRLKPAPSGGYTLLGSPTVIAKFTLPGETSQVAARLLDVGPDGQQTLVSRGLWRPETGGPSKQVFQLHPNGWHFAEGHVPKLELLPKDSGGAPLNSYGRASNNQQDVTVSDLELRLPVRERPGSIEGLILAPAEKVLPKGYELAADFAGRDPRAKLTKGALKVAGDELRARVKCPKQFAACTDGRITVKSAGAKQKAAFKVASGTFDAKGGKKQKVELKLTAKARRYFADRAKLGVAVKVTTAETPATKTQRRRAVG
jgi:dienelactone hydrolase